MYLQMVHFDALRSKANKALVAAAPEDAACYLAEIIGANPDDRRTRIALAIALGDAGNPVGALRILRATADHLAHKGFLLPAIVVVRFGLKRAPNDPSLVATLQRLHVRGVRAKAGNLPTPPPLRIEKKSETTAVTAEDLLKLKGQERLTHLAQVGAQFPHAGQATKPLPMPLFCELDSAAFVETVKTLHYKRVTAQTKLLKEGEPGDTLLIIASGHVGIVIGDKECAILNPGAVIGEMALITGAPRSATVVAQGEVEYFEISRADIQALALSKPQIAEELVAYCRKRLIANLMRSSPLFKRFDDETRYRLLERFSRRGFTTGQQVIQQGNDGTGLFVLATGEVVVSVSNGETTTVVANLGPGEVFGEISLLKNQPTTATVTARGQVGVLFLPREDFQRTLDENQEVRDYLQGLSDERIKAAEAIEDAEVLEADDLIIL